MPLNKDKQSVINSSNTKVTYCPYTLVPWSIDLDSKNLIYSTGGEESSDLASEPEGTLTAPATAKPPCFEMNESLNRKVVLWNGNVLRMSCDAFVHPTNERFERCTPLTNALYNQAGPELLKCLYNKLKYCPVGSIKITKGYSIVPSYIIHTASPHYKCKFHTASETALFNCYFHSLQAAKHYNFRTLAIPNLALSQHNYPEMDGLHLGIRVIRKFLESYSDSFDLIILCAKNHHEYEQYRKVMKLYFPRNTYEEQMQHKYLPANNGGPMGEPYVPERAIRIRKNPIISRETHTDSGLDDSDDDFHSPLIGSFGTTTSEINIDECRERLMELNYQQEFNDHDHEQFSDINNNNTANNNNSGHHHNHNSFTSSLVIPMPQLGSHSSGNHHFSHGLSHGHDHGYDSPPMTPKNHYGSFDNYDPNDQLMIQEHRRQLRFERLLRKTQRAQKDLSQSTKDLLEQSIYINHLSKDQEILTIIGQQLSELYQDPNGLNGNFDFILAHLLKMLDRLSRNGDSYVIVYFHTLVDSNNTSSVGQISSNKPSKRQLFSRLYEYISYTHWKNLKAFYVVHPTIINRIYLWWLKTFYCKFLKDKIQFVHRLDELKTYLNQLKANNNNNSTQNTDHDDNNNEENNHNNNNNEDFCQEYITKLPNFIRQYDDASK